MDDHPTALLPLTQRAAPPEAAADETWWRCGPIDGVTRGSVTRLQSSEYGSELELRDGRLNRGARYDASPDEARRYLARVGAMLRLRLRGRYLLHAAGIVAPNGEAWILCGESGTGKSTLAYVLARHGWPLLGDDGVVLEGAADHIIVHGWRQPMRLSIELAEWFPELQARTALTNWADPRHRTPVDVPFARRARAAGLIVLERGATDALTPLAPTPALAVLVRQASFLLLTDGHAPAHLQLLQRLVESVPCYTLRHTPAQLAELPSTMRAVAA